MTIAVTALLFSSFSPDRDERVLVRRIEIPEGTEGGIFESAFHFGQNDFQPKQMCSVSVGDVVNVHRNFGEGEAATMERRVVLNVGFSDPLEYSELLDLWRAALNGRDEFFDAMQAFER